MKKIVCFAFCLIALNAVDAKPLAEDSIIQTIETSPTDTVVVKKAEPFAFGDFT